MSEQRRSTARLAAHWRARLLPAGLLAALSLSLELCLYLVAVIGGMATPHMAVALPLYARQTGQPCATCHTAFLELTPFGRRFKLGGYTLGGGNWNGPPFAVMLQPTFTNTQGAQPGGAAPGFGVNNNFVMQQISLFTGGRITENSGAFIQGTYDGVAHRFGWDNTDIRYARSIDIGGHTLLWGITANNNPTVQDVWNTTPAWSFPFISPQLAPMPDGYAVHRSGVCATGRRVSAPTAFSTTSSISSSAATARCRPIPSSRSGSTRPGRARSAARHPIGASRPKRTSATTPGKWVPSGSPHGCCQWACLEAGTDSFTDIGVDTQYQYLGDPHMVTFRGAWIHENHNTGASQALGLADNSNDQLRSLNASVSYIYDQTWSLTHRTGLGWRHHRCDAVRHRDRQPEQRRLDLRARLSAVQPWRPVVLAMAEFPHRSAIHPLDQIRRRHHQYRRHGARCERQ